MASLNFKLFIHLHIVIVILHFPWHMGEISQGVQSLNLMSYLLGVLGPFFGDLGLCYGKN